MARGAGRFFFYLADKASENSARFVMRAGAQKRPSVRLRFLTADRIVFKKGKIGQAVAPPMMKVRFLSLCKTAEEPRGQTRGRLGKTGIVKACGKAVGQEAQPAERRARVFLFPVDQGKRPECAFLDRVALPGFLQRHHIGAHRFARFGACHQIEQSQAEPAMGGAAVGG